MSIKLKLICLISAFVGLIAAGVIGLHMWSSSAADAGKVINLAGRQRMLTQKMTKEMLFTMVGIDQKAAMDKTKNLFDKTLNGLIDGDLEMGLKATKNPVIVDQLLLVRGLWDEFQKDLKKGLDTQDVKVLTALTEESVAILKEMNAAVKLYEQDANQGIVTLEAWGIAFLLLAFFNAGIAYLLIDKNIIQKIREIQQLSQKVIAEKDLCLRLNPTGHDELEQTARAFDHVLDAFSEMNASTQRLEKKLQSEVNTLLGSIKENTQSMAAQQDEIILVSTAMNQMASTVQEVAQNTQSAATSANDTQEAAVSSSKLVKSTINLTYDLAKEINAASSNIEKLAKSSDSISGIADTISNIAEQTNLLALNAAIEAARAGEQGRGFAVVADEVRSLAQRTQEATSEIHKLITELQDTTNASVETMRNSQEQSEHCVSQSEKMSQALESIISSVDTINSLNQQIAVAAEEQNSVAEEMSNNIVKVEQQTEKTTQNVNKTSNQVDSLSTMADQLRVKLVEYKIACKV